MTAAPRRPVRLRRVAVLGPVVLAVVVAVGALLATAAPGRATAPTRAAQAREIASTLHCPVCQDLSAADSPAPLARQMRLQIRHRLAAGESPQRIRQRFVASYGPSVLMTPPDHGWGRAARVLPGAVLAGALLGGVLLVRRGVRGGRTARASGATAGGAPLDHRLLDRQLLDLEDDRAAGRVGEEEHAAVRAELEGQSAALPPESPEQRASEGAGRGPTRRATRRPTRRSARAAVVVLATGGVVAVSVLLAGSLDHRPAAAAGGGAAPVATAAGDSVAGPGPDPLAAVATALTEVRLSPRRASAHVELARAYAAAGRRRLAAVEYLAAARLDPGSAEAGTALAMVAYEAGSARQADALVTRALAAHPGYPEALYTRGLIRALGLHRSAAAIRDLEAYQRAAPLGSHRATVATVLALLARGAIR